MVDTKEIGERLYQTSLLDVQWGLFSQSARLLFADEGARLILHLDRIHCAVVRQSLQTPSVFPLGPNCDVHYLDVSKDTKFLETYLSDATLLPSHIVLYDGAARTPSDTAFQKPYHVSIVCRAGDLDFLADLVKLEELR